MPTSDCVDFIDEEKRNKLITNVTFKTHQHTKNNVTRAGKQQLVESKQKNILLFLLFIDKNHLIDISKLHKDFFIEIGLREVKALTTIPVGLECQHNRASS
jgi:hypothetical protein